MVVVNDSKKKPIAFGSGFFVGDGLVATNYHVIEDARNALQIRIKVAEQRQTIAIERILGVDTANDVAILEIRPDAFVGRSLQLGNGSQVGIGDSIYVSGSPEGLEGTFSEGIVSSRRKDGRKQYLQITAPISHGSSGGPVLNRYGEVIGLAVAIMEDGQNLNFAVPVSYLAALMTKGGHTPGVERGLPGGTVGAVRGGAPEARPADNALSSPPPPPLASDWTYVIKSETNSIYYNRRISHAPDGTLRVWTAFLPAKIGSLVDGNEDIVQIRSPRELWMFVLDCRQDRFKVTDWVKYDAAYKVLDSGSYADTWSPIPPDSLVDALSHKVCAVPKSKR
jgi:hypothetical protein